MTAKEKVLRELDNLDEQELDALYELVQRLLEAQRANTALHSFLERHLLHNKELEEEELAAEGYQLYAQEAVEFAA